ncbi:MAG TPA: class I SAM-dependent methyltransferase [Rhodocyclaceae bacterium]|nr:class I SAM-dependent methyltransferase [Rhodocyclaceae bacterium]
MPALKALFAQLVSAIFVLSIGRSGMLPPLSLLALASLQGAVAAFISAWLRSARWWIPIHLLFMPAAVFVARLGLPVWIYPIGFVVLALVFWTTFRTQVPLFLSSKLAVHKLTAQLPDKNGLRVLDVGSGVGSFVSRLARLRPDWNVKGIETAPAPFALSRWLARNIPNAYFTHGDFWQHSLSDYDIVYAFLSPVPMPRLWHKAQREMRPGTWLVSNSFPIPGLKPTLILPVNDRMASTLHCYQIGSKRADASR